jgi:DegV family protein with EDD domain
MIGLCTDSNSQITRELAARYGVVVVPLTVTIDGVDHLEGVDLSADEFWASFAGGATPQVSTSQPSPGRFLEAYERLAERGADEIVSIHVGADVSGTLNAARVAAVSSPVPVRVVDSRSASFAVACCVWEAGEAIAEGATAREVEQVVHALAPTIGNVFVVGALDLVRAGGRLTPGATVPDDGIPVLELVDGRVRVLASARSAEEAVRHMVDHVLSWGTGLKVAVGVADAGADPMGDALHDDLVHRREVREVVRYRVGPSVGVHTGPGTAGAVFFPTAS